MTTSGGSPIPDDTPATLNSASTCPPTAAHRAFDRCRIGQVDLMKLVDLSARRRLSNPMTSAPSSVSWRTTCAPMPDAHPVTTARRPS